MTQQSENPEDQTPQQVQQEVERELFGKWTILLRNASGMLAIVTLCITSILNGYTTHLSVADKGIWPSEITLLITNVGLVVVAWTWMNANKTISTIMQATDFTDRVRNRIADVISTEKKGGTKPSDSDTSNG